MCAHIDKSPIPNTHQRKCMTLKLKCLIETKLTDLMLSHPNPQHTSRRWRQIPGSLGSTMFTQTSPQRDADLQMKEPLYQSPGTNTAATSQSALLCLSDGTAGTQLSSPDVFTSHPQSVRCLSHFAERTMAPIKPLAQALQGQRGLESGD